MYFGKIRTRALVVISLALCIYATAIAADAIKASELVDRIANGGAPFILDVRTPEEFADSHIPGAVNIPIMDLVKSGAQLKPYKEKEIVVYCEVGPRAAFAEYLMVQNGFTDVRDLQGHIQQWLKEGRPVETQ